MNASEILEVLLGEFYDRIKRFDGIVKREARFPDVPSKVKVAIGMRRVGKTTFLYQQILELLQSGVDRTAILYLNFEDDRLMLFDGQKIAQLVDAFYALYPQNHDRQCYLFFDEIQNVDNWTLVIRRLHDTKQAQIYLTGSSAKLLSKEIATGLRGRSLPTEIWPYSFQEFAKAKKMPLQEGLYDQKTRDLRRQLFQDYLSVGGFPEVIEFTPDTHQRTLQEYLDVVIFRDIIERHRIKNSAVIKTMILSMIHNVGRPFSVNKFYNELKTRGFQIGKDTLYEYADYIEDVYLAFFVPLYTPSVRKMQAHPKKLYAIDPGMVRALTLDYEHDLGRLFENVVFLELKRLGCTVFSYLTLQRHEVDFLVEWGRGGRKLFQVVWDMQDEKTMQREVGALEEGKRELKIEGEIVTLDAFLKEGIKL